MNNIYKKLFSGYLLILLDIRLGTFDILMDPIGYFLVLSALIALYRRDQTRDVLIASCLIGFMSIQSIMPYFVGTQVSSMYLSIGTYIVMLISMICDALVCTIVYFASIRLLEEGDFKLKLEKEANLYAILNGLILLGFSMLMMIPLTYLTSLFMVTVGLGFILQLRFVITLNKLKKLWFEIESPKLSKI